MAVMHPKLSLSRSFLVTLRLFHTSIIREAKSLKPLILFGWGAIDTGVLGSRSPLYKQSTPMVISLPPLGTIQQIASGYSHAAAIIKNKHGTCLLTWGLNSHGQLGMCRMSDMCVCVKYVNVMFTVIGFLLK